MRGPRIRAAGAMVVLAVVCSTPSAQTPGGSLPQELFVLPPVSPLPGAGDALSDSSRSIVLRRIVIRGNSAVRTDELEKITAGFLQRPLAADDVEDLRQKLTRAYVDRGYVNSGAVFEQGALAGDTLTVDVIEGRLTGVRISGLDGLRESYVVNRLRLDPGAALNVEDLRERFALLLEDPLFARVNSRLVPGDRLGEAALDVDEVRARPYQFTVFANNHRPPSVGAESIGVSGVVRNLTGWGDALSGTRQAPVGSGASGGRTSLSWTTPIPATRLEFTLQHDQGSSSVIEAALRPLDIQSRLRSDEVGLGWVVQETLARKVSVGITRSLRENSTTLLGAPFSFIPFEPNGVSSVAAWRLWQQASFRSAAQVVALRSTITSARNNLVDVVGLPAGIQTPPTQYVYWQGQAQFVRRVGDAGAQVIVRGALQATPKTLVALDRFAIGGATTVRGFRENTLVRDRGHFIGMEFEQPVAGSEATDVRLSVAPFADYGRGRNVGGGADTATSLGLATRLRGRALSAELAVARRVTTPQGFAPSQRTLQDRGIHFQVSYAP